MLRTFLFCVVVLALSLTEGSAGPGKLPRNDTDQQVNRPSKRRKHSDEKLVIEDQKTVIAGEQETSIVEDPTISILPFPLERSPTTKERKYFSPFRRRLAELEYRTKNRKKSGINSPLVRKIYHDNDSGNYWSRCCRFEDKTVYQADFLFDPNAEALTDEKWITNLQRMQSGLCPIGHKGIVSEKERDILLEKEIKNNQKRYRIELHHLTQKDTGTNEDPICEMTQSAHMGKNARLILEFNSQSDSGTVKIVSSSLTTKDDAQELCHEGQFIVTNVLHFRQGYSLINRDVFGQWKENYWKMRAAEIKAGNFIGVANLPTPFVPRRLFQDLEIDNDPLEFDGSTG